MRQVTTTSRRLVLAAAVALAAAPAFAQDNWPTKPVRIVVPFPAGSITDTVARVLAEHLTKTLGQQVLVDNKAGANGLTGLAEVARSPADGYTLAFTNSSSVTINWQLNKQAPYKASDLVPVTMVTEAPFILVTTPDWSQKNHVGNVKELIDYAKREPGKLNYGSAGIGNIAHLSFAQLSNRAGVQTTHIPYKSAAAAQLAMLSGDLPAAFDTWAALPQIQAGKLKPLAVTSAKRMPQLPDVPTIGEAGYPDVQVTFWLGLLAPANTPAPIVQKLNALAQGLRGEAKSMAVLANQGDVVLLEPAAFKQRVEREVSGWGAVIKKEAISLD